MKGAALTDKWGRGWLVLPVAMAAVGIVLQLEPSGPISTGMRAAAALCVVLGLALVGSRFLKKWAHRAGALSPEVSVPIQILGVKALGEGRSLLVVQVEGERLLLGTSRERIVHLAHLSGRQNPSEGFITPEK